MPDFLTRRNGTWHFVRRVPTEYAALDPRKIIKHSTKVRIADDRTGRRASRVAGKLNEELEAHWRGLVEGKSKQHLAGFEEAKRRARALGFDYIENSQLVVLPFERSLERIEALASKGFVNDGGARAAALGSEKRPVPNLSNLFAEYEAVTKDEVRDLSPDQRRIWRNGRIRAVNRLKDLIGDKAITDITEDDAVAYVDDWRDRVVAGEVLTKTANKDIGQLSRMLKDISTRRRLKLPDLFQGLRLRGEADRSRVPFENEFIQKRLLARGALDGLNDEAKDVVYVIIETGLRPSEIINLTEKTIHLDAKIPHVSIEADGRRLKTEDSARQVPLVGAALKAMRKHPHGFPHYRDKGSNLSATVNKYLMENGLRPSKSHTVYSLRHSFKDRLVAAEAPDSLIDSLMGHKTYKPKYGKGPSLELKLKFLSQIAFTSPDRV